MQSRPRSPVRRRLSCARVRRFAQVKSVRGIANPNIGFTCQLLQWQKRRKSPPAKSRLYRMGPHCQHAPLLLVSAWRDPWGQGGGWDGEQQEGEEEEEEEEEETGCGTRGTCQRARSSHGDVYRLQGRGTGQGPRQRCRRRHGAAPKPQALKPSRVAHAYARRCPGSSRRPKSTRRTRGGSSTPGAPLSSRCALGFGMGVRQGFGRGRKRGIQVRLSFGEEGGRSHPGETSGGGRAEAGYPGAGGGSPGALTSGLEQGQVSGEGGPPCQATATPPPLTLSGRRATERQALWIDMRCLCGRSRPRTCTHVWVRKPR